MLPDPYEWLLLFGAAYSTWRLVALDTIMERPRMMLLRLLRQDIGGKADAFLLCPWCSGFWITGGWYVLFWTTSAYVVLVVAAPVASRALLGMAAKLDD